MSNDRQIAAQETAKALIEGRRALLVEDLTTDGGSKKDFVQARRDSGQRCDHVFVFFFDIFAHRREELAAMGVTLHALATWRDVLAWPARTNIFLTTRLTTSKPSSPTPSPGRRRMAASPRRRDNGEKTADRRLNSS